MINTNANEKRVQTIKLYIGAGGQLCNFRQRTTIPNSVESRNYKNMSKNYSLEGLRCQPDILLFAGSVDEVVVVTEHGVCNGFGVPIEHDRIRRQIVQIKQTQHLLMTTSDHNRGRVREIGGFNNVFVLKCVQISA
jgi:hypothetical protein